MRRRSCHDCNDRPVPRLRDPGLRLPDEIGVADGLAYSLWLPEAGAGRGGGAVILHGAGSCKESHHDFARVLVAAGLGAVAFDQRGHGDSEGAMDGRALDDIAAMAALLRARLGDPRAPVALRGSSMGGYFALVAAEPAQAAAVVAICPASEANLRRGVAQRRFEAEIDAPALDRLLAGHEVVAAVERLEAPILLLHAEGDEVVPVEQSRELAALLRHPASRFLAIPGGHHRSIQHDEELQAVSLRFIERALAAAR
jgi:uncharacterized protein